MVYLINAESWTSFIYNPVKGRYIRESEKVAWWVSNALGYEALKLPNLKVINLTRKLLEALPKEELEILSKKDVKTLVSTTHPEYFI